jgi:MFS family permease
VHAYVALLRRNAVFRRAFAADLLSLGGDGFAIVPLLTTLPGLTGGGWLGALVLGADMSVVALLGPYAGTVADRFDRRRVLVVSNLGSAAAVLLLMLVRTPSTAWIAVPAVAAIAVSKAFYTPAAAAALPNLVGAADLPAANALSSGAWAAMVIAGSSLGGLLSEHLGPSGCYLLDAGFLLSAAALTISVRRPYQSGSGGPGGSGFGAALRFIAADEVVRALVTSKPVITLGNGALTLFPLLAAVVFHAGPAGAGLFYAARGLGYVVGPLVLRGPLLRPGRLLPGLAVLSAAYGVAYVCVGFAPSFWAALVLVTIAHSAGAANWVLSNYAVQHQVPDRLRGRVLSADFTLAMLALTASQLTMGALSDHVPLRVLASGGGAVVLVNTAIWTFTHRARLRGTARRGAAGEMRNSGGS